MTTPNHGGPGPEGAPQEASTPEERLDKLRALCEEDCFRDSPAVAGWYAQELLRQMRQQQPRAQARTLSQLQAVYQRFPEDLPLACHYAQGLFLLTRAEKGEVFDRGLAQLKALALDERLGGEPELAFWYGKGLLVLARRASGEPRRDTVSQLWALAKDYPDDPNLVQLYAQGLATLIEEQPEEDSAHTVEMLEALLGDFPEAAGMARAYAKGLAAYAEQQELRPRLESLDTLQALHRRFPQDEAVAAFYCSGMSQVLTALEPGPRDAMAEQLRAVYEDEGFQEDQGVAEAYAWGLFRLSKAPEPETKRRAVEQLAALWGQERWQKNYSIATMYGGGLVNLSGKLHTQEGRAACAQALHTLWTNLGGEIVGSLYACGLENWMELLPPEEAIPVLGKVKHFYHKFPYNENAQQARREAHKFLSGALLRDGPHRDCLPLAHACAASLVCSDDRPPDKDAPADRAAALDTLRQMWQDEHFRALPDLPQLYAKALLNMAGYAPLEARPALMEELRLLRTVPGLQENLPLAYLYAEGLSKLSFFVPDYTACAAQMQALWEEGSFREDPVMAMYFARILADQLQRGQRPDCAGTVDTLRALFQRFRTAPVQLVDEQHPTGFRPYQLAEEYARGLAALAETVPEQAQQAALELQALMDDPALPQDGTITKMYAIGLRCLAAQQPLEGCTRSVEALQALREEPCWQYNRVICEQHAMALRALSALQDAAGRAQTAQAMRALRVQQCRPFLAASSRECLDGCLAWVLEQYLEVAPPEEAPALLEELDALGQEWPEAPVIQEACQAAKKHWAAH